MFHCRRLRCQLATTAAYPQRWSFTVTNGAATGRCRLLVSGHARRLVYCRVGFVACTAVGGPPTRSPAWKASESASERGRYPCGCGRVCSGPRFIMRARAHVDQRCRLAGVAGFAACGARRARSCHHRARWWRRPTVDRGTTPLRNPQHKCHGIPRAHSCTTAQGSSSSFSSASSRLGTSKLQMRSCWTARTRDWSES